MRLSGFRTWGKILHRARSRSLSLHGINIRGSLRKQTAVSGKACNFFLSFFSSSFLLHWSMRTGPSPIWFLFLALRAVHTFPFFFDRNPARLRAIAGVGVESHVNAQPASGSPHRTFNFDSLRMWLHKRSCALGPSGTPDNCKIKLMTNLGVACILKLGKRAESEELLSGTSAPVGSSERDISTILIERPTGW